MSVSADRMAIDDEDAQYASSDDSDFAPDAAPGAGSDAADSDDELEAAVASQKKQTKAKSKGDGADDADYDNSGDEAIIERGRKRRKKAQHKGVDEDEEGGEGGLVKTRRQRAAEKEERKHTLVTGPVTIDVDAVWAQMLAGSTAEPSRDDRKNGDGEDSQSANGEVEAQPEAPPADPSALVRIKHTYNFAGRVHTEEKLVARDSAEAKLYFASKGLPVPSGDDEPAEDLPIKRVARKAFRSAFEPVIIDPTPQRADLNLGVAARTQAAMDAQQARKLNTVEKSRMDWAGFVDKEGIKDELELAGKSKDSYAARQDFLARSEVRREDEARRARLGVR